MLTNMTLTQLFKQMMNSDLLDHLDNQTHESQASLRMSLNMSIENIMETMPEAMDLFKLIGMLPAGITPPELNKLWGDDSWIPLKVELIEDTMLNFRANDKTFTVLPFMVTRAFELLEEEPVKKNEFHQRICNFYTKFCKDFIKKIDSHEFDIKELVKRESNIWACIYRGINRRKHNDEFDKEKKEMFKLVRSQTKDLTSASDRRQSARFGGGLLEGLIPDLDEDPVVEESDQDASKEDAGYKPSSNKQAPKDQSFSSHDESIDLKRKRNTRHKHKDNKGVHRTGTLVAQDTFKDKFTGNAEIDLTVDENFILEEQLVMYYISIVIRLSKLSDALKALNEYSKKRNLSVRAQAHIFQFRGTLALLCQDKNEEVQSHFEKAITCYRKIGGIKGEAICELALVRAE